MTARHLEKRLFQGEVSDLAEAAFIASGVATRAELEDCLSLFDGLRRQIAEEISPGDDVTRLRELFNWLWRTKPRRYRQGGNFRLGDVLRAQLAPDVLEVGNCLGLTLLYNCLAQRLGLRMKAVYLEVAFDGQPHVFSSYRAGEVAIDIEHILPDGFDYKGHLGNPLRVEWDEAGLLADIYHSRGNLFFESRRFGDAVKLYQKALRLNLKHNQARLNMGLALAELGRTREAARLLQEPP